MSGGRFYFDWANHRTLLRVVRQHPDPKTRRVLTGVIGVGVPAIAAVHAVCFALDPLLFPALRRTEVRRPVFNIAHARSGTTYLHRIMAKDPQFSSLLMYEMLLPSLLQKKVARGLLAVDAALGSPVRRRIKKAESKALAATNDAHKTSLFEPEEDDFLLACSLGSGLWIAFLPYMAQFDFYHVDEWPLRKRKRVMGFYKECIRRQLVLTGAPTHLSKNPTFTGRVESVIETFPDARFIVPMRNPTETIPSVLKLLQLSWERSGARPEDIQDSLRLLAEQSYHAYRHPLEVLEKHPESLRCVVNYRDLITDPAGTVERVYKELDLEPDPGLVQALRSKRQNAHDTTHRYSLEEFGLNRDEIVERLGDLFEQYGWPTEEEQDS